MLAPRRVIDANGPVPRLVVALLLFVFLSPACVDQRSRSSPVVVGQRGPTPTRRGETVAEPGRLGARPHADRPSGSQDPGLRRLPLRGGDALAFVPHGLQKMKAAPFALELHGANGDARGGINLFLNAQPQRVILLSVKSRASTWDLVQGGFGPDVEFIDRALDYVFDRWPIDKNHLAVVGFSDGASYALSLGITNGDLFSHVVALSPGFVQAGRPRGHPRIFIAHGSHDEVLPIGSTSRQIVPRLRDAGYEVTFKVHGDGHNPRPMVRSALDWFLQG